MKKKVPIGHLFHGLRCPALQGRAVCFHSMDLRLFFIELPPESVLAALDRRLETLARRQEAVSGGKRLWITHVPETQTRPFLHARPFDIFVSPMRFNSSLREDYRVGLGVEPKRCMICRAQDDSCENAEILFVLCAEIMAKCSALLGIDEKLGRLMFKIDERELEFPSQCLDEFPGCVYEVAHEMDDGDLGVEWFVDARWLKAWISKQHPLQSSHPEASRFSSLDYS